MHRISVLLTLLLLLVVAPAALAQATRTWVSGVGDDVNPCSRTAPCKTFAGAISKTAAGGEISVLDPGGYGTVSITKSITINGAATIAGVLNSAANGITINGSDITVNLVNLRISGGQTSPGVNGIRIVNAAHVSVTNCDITNFSLNGIVDERTTQGTLTVTNTRIYNSTRGQTRVGIRMQASAGTVANSLLCDRCEIFGHLENGSIGVLAASGAVASIARSAFHSNAFAVQANGGGSVMVSDTTIMANRTGVRVFPASTVLLSNCSITHNTMNGLDFSGGTIQSFGNNQIAANAGNNGAGITPVPRQ